MNVGITKPRLYIVRQEAESNSAEFDQKYKSITDHLIKVIQKDGRLDLNLEEFSASSDTFSEKVAKLRGEADLQDRPFAFLFIKPNPKKDVDSLNQTINDLEDIADASIRNDGNGAEEPALASSVLFFNQSETTKSNPSTYQDDLPFLSAMESRTEDSIGNTSGNFRNIFISKPKLKAEITTYANGLIEHVLAMHQASALNKTSQHGQIKLGNEDTLDSLSNKDQDTILEGASWKELADENPRNTKFQIMLRFFNGANVGKIAAEFDINASQINHILNAFLSDPDSFLEAK